jgi:phosphoenolpyruvate synthase/pyruvate phosphate dikinase
MHSYVVNFDEIDRTQTAIAGGKGANLAELSRIEGVHVPPGFCVTTLAFDRAMRESPSPSAIAMPEDVAVAITDALARHGEHWAYAVRSSATTEDSPTTSFAGQHDSFLGVVGRAAMLEDIVRCWASLFSERATAYRARNGLDDSSVRMAVVVQRMVAPRASGVLFTADPITGNRHVVSIDAALGAGEALVSGLVNPENYRVRAGEVIRDTPHSDRGALLSDAQAVGVAALGRRIEAHFGTPQDIEWCLADDEFQIVQSRPITTLFPIPSAADAANHVYVSVGHNQMMTDAMTPLGLSVWQMVTPRPMAESGGRLFVDVSQQLARPSSRAGLLEVFGRGDPLMGDALRTIVERGFIPSLPDAPGATPPIPGSGPPSPIATDPTIVRELIEQSRASVDRLEHDIEGLSGSALLDFIANDILELKRILFDARSHQAIMAGMEAAWWLNAKLFEWLGEPNAADVLTQSVPNNVTSEMGLALMDVADAIRPHAEVVAFLRRVDGDGFLDDLRRIPGGRESREAIQAWLDHYGMRAVGEIDITRPRWRERPSMLLPLILSHVDQFARGEAARRFEQGLRAAAAKEADVLARLRALPDGARNAEETKGMIDRVRTFAGYREYPKYGMMQRELVYKQALLREADRLTRAGVIAEPEDVFFFRFEELREVVRTNRADAALIRRRRRELRTHQGLRPPRVLTSEGEAVPGNYRRSDLPAGALEGLPVSAGTMEGRARVILDMSAADLEAGDILVTVYTDPGWTPLFVGIAALVTEVGGQMTHGAVIAREYGLPAVVGVENATRLIRDGQRIRVNGTEGYIIILDDMTR